MNQFQMLLLLLMGGEKQVTNSAQIFTTTSLSYYNSITYH